MKSFPFRPWQLMTRTKSTSATQLEGKIDHRTVDGFVRDDKKVFEYTKEKLTENWVPGQLKELIENLRRVKCAIHRSSKVNDILKDLQKPTFT